MKLARKILLYLRHISFIMFLIAMIIMLPGFYKYDTGTICLITSLVYTIITFIVMFIKNKNEESSFFNNFVLCFLHLYICLVAYKYNMIGNYATNINNEYFSFNFLMISICMGILCVNKLIIINSK